MGVRGSEDSVCRQSLWTTAVDMGTLGESGCTLVCRCLRHHHSYALSHHSQRSAVCEGWLPCSSALRLMQAPWPLHEVRVAQFQIPDTISSERSLCAPVQSFVLLLFRVLLTCFAFDHMRFFFREVKICTGACCLVSSLLVFMMCCCS